MELGYHTIMCNWRQCEILRKTGFGEQLVLTDVLHTNRASKSEQGKGM